MIVSACFNSGMCKALIVLFTWTPDSFVCQRCFSMGNTVTFISRTANRLVRRLLTRPGPKRTTPAGNPVPLVIHKTVKQQQLGLGRLIVIGDVHGCHDELQQLLRKLQYQQGTDNLVFVGDLVNKGPKSAQVLATVRNLCHSSHCWCVRGNHDDAALAARRHLTKSSEPLKPKYQWVQQMQPEDEQFMLDLPFSLTLQGYNILVVHAGLLPNTPLEKQQLFHLTKMRDVQQTETGSYVGLEKPAEGSQAWASMWSGPQHVFFGHDAKRSLQTCSHATGLDTGCVYGGQLTACVLPPLVDLQQDTTFMTAAAAAAAGVHSGASGSGGQGLTREHLQAQLFDVQAACRYEAPGGKSIAALPSDQSIAGDKPGGVSQQ